MNNILFSSAIIQPKDGPFLITIALCLVIVIPMVIFSFAIIHSMKNASITLTENELTIKSIFYGRKIPIENILINDIRRINLEEETGYNISLRRNGISLPGYQAGWMRLRNGERALTFLTDKSNVVFIPTKEYLVLVSIPNIDEFINRIRALNPTAP